MPLQIRRGTELERSALTSLTGLVVGELLFTTDGGKLYVGDGTTPGGIVATSFSSGDAKDAAGAAITSGTHQSISFTYDNIGKTINSTLNLSDYQGTIKADSFKGSVLADDGSSLGGVTLVDATNGSVNLDGTVKGNIVPDLNITYDIGTPLLRFKDLYLSGTSLHLGNAVLTSVGTVIDLPLGSTLGGVPIAGGDTSDFKGNIVADDSTIIVNTSTKVVSAAGGFVGDLTGTVSGSLVGYHFGDMTGSVFADDSTPLVDAVDKRFYTNDLIIENNVITAGVDRKLILGKINEPASLTILGLPVDEEPTINLFSATTLPGSAGTVVNLNTCGTTLDSPTELTSGQTFGNIRFNGYQRFIGDPTPSYRPLASIQATLDVEGDGATVQPSASLRIFLSDGFSIGSAVSYEFTKDRGLEGEIFRAKPYADAAARAADIATPLAGMVTFISDDGTLGGTPPVPKLQVYDGTAWVNLN